MNSAVSAAEANRRLGKKAIWFFAAAAGMIWLIALVEKGPAASAGGALAPVSQNPTAQSAATDNEVGYWVKVGEAGGSL
ncbi:MAG: hypothetical protein JO133_13990 [Burkholderiaceae bacterium]|nr:hypothetical protein [Burkholderiaceae bacterium]